MKPVDSVLPDGRLLLQLDGAGKKDSLEEFLNEVLWETDEEVQFTYVVVGDKIYPTKPVVLYVDLETEEEMYSEEYSLGCPHQFWWFTYANMIELCKTGRTIVETVGSARIIIPQLPVEVQAEIQKQKLKIN